MGERPACKWNAADGLACLQRADLGYDAAPAQFGHQQVQAAEPEVAAEDGWHADSLRLVDGYLAVLGVIAQRCHAADPQALALGGRDLVANTLGGDLTL